MLVITLFDLLFPKICIGCQGEGSWLCDECREELLCMQGVGCPSCEKVTWDNRYCQIHQTNHVATGLFHVGFYHEPLLRKAIQTLKYEGVKELSEPLGRLLYERIAYWLVDHDIVVIPIPLHQHRQAERGFNQAELLSRKLKMPVLVDVLVRYRKTKAQATLSDAERLSNMSNIYGVRVSQQTKIIDKTVLLVDDVYTTGATLEEAAKVLVKAGAREVWGAVLAKS